VRIKPTHLRECAKVLQEGDFANAEEAAKAVVQTIDRMRAEDNTFAVVRQYNSPVSGPLYMGYGPYPTFNAAQKAIETGRVGLPGFGAVAVVPMKSSESVDAKFDSLDSLGDHIGGAHWARVREKVGV
jgi:hypothetical protein